MDTHSLIVGLACIISAFVIVLLAIPLLRGETKQNMLYGVRFSESFESEDAWNDINRYGAKQMLRWSIPIFMIGVFALLIPLQSRPVLAILLSLAPLLILGAAIQTKIYARKYKRMA